MSSSSSWFFKRESVVANRSSAGKLRAAHGAAQRRPFLVIAHRQHAPVIVAGARVAALRRAPRVAVAHAPAQVAVVHPIHDELAGVEAPQLVHAYVDPQAFSRLLAMAQRERDAQQGGPARQEVDVRLPGLRRNVAAIARDVGQAVRGLLRRRLRRVLGVGPVAVAVAGVRYHDDVGLQLLHVGVIEAPATHHARSEVLHHYVAFLDEVLQHGQAVRLAQVEHQRLLAPVQDVVRRRSVPRVLADLVVGVGPAERASPRGVDAARAFDLDDLGAQVRKQSGGVGQREHVGGLDHPYPFQRQSGHLCFSYESTFAAAALGRSQAHPRVARDGLRLPAVQIMASSRRRTTSSLA